MMNIVLNDNELNYKIIVERHQDLPPVAMPMLPF
jgi:hypothetical protein